MAVLIAGCGIDDGVVALPRTVVAVGERLRTAGVAADTDDAVVGGGYPHAAVHILDERLHIAGGEIIAGRTHEEPLTTVGGGGHADLRGLPNPHHSVALAIERIHTVGA